LGSCFEEFLKANGLESVFKKGEKKLTCAGKNFGSFDLQFLKRAPGFTNRIRMEHRTFDPGSMYFRLGDDRIPGTEECCQRANLVTPVVHQALADAQTVIQLIRRSVNRREVMALPVAA